MLPRAFPIAAAIAISAALLAPSARAGAEDYALELVESTQSVGAGAILTLRLTDLRNGAPVDDAVVFATRLDMAPDGMETMTSPVEPLASEQPGTYRFAADLTMAGNWRFSVAAKVQGEAETVSARLVLGVQP